MRSVTEAVLHMLKIDPIILAYVGLDQNDKVRVYEGVAKPNEVPPFLVVTFLPGVEPQGHFGDMHAIEQPQYQVTCWGRLKTEAWSLYDVVQEVFELGNFDIDLLPYSPMRVRKIGGAPELTDPDTSWTQIPVTYEVTVSR